MPRPATGQVREVKSKTGEITYGIRFSAYGKRPYVTLGKRSEGWTREKAEENLRHVLSDVERGIWQPSRPEPVEAPKEVPDFHTFSSEWLSNLEPELKERTIEDYAWSLSYHLLPFFKDHRLDEITVEEVDRYKATKLREGKRRKAAIDAGKPLRDSEGRPLRPLSPNTLNKTITRLVQIFEQAVEYGHVDKNPAKGRRRRAAPVKPKRTWVEVEQLMALLETTDRWMRPVIATLAGTGLRNGELCALDWRDVNLATARITVEESKTAAGEGREIRLSPALREELTEWKSRSPGTQPDDAVFISRPRDGKNARETPRNVQARLKAAIRAANKQLAAEGIEPINEKVTPHSMRRTYAMLRGALGDNLVWTIEQMGHADYKTTLRFYMKSSKRRDELSGRYLAAFDAALQWASMGIKSDASIDSLADQAQGYDPETASESQKQHPRGV